MNKMRKTTLFQRLLGKGEHATQLVDQRRALQDAIAKFQVGASLHSALLLRDVERSWTGLFTQPMQCVRVDVCLTRIERKQDGIVGPSVDHSKSTGTEGNRVAVRGGDPTRTSIEDLFFFSPTFTIDLAAAPRVG